MNTFLNAQTENDSLAKYSYEELEKKFYDTRFTDKDLCKLYADKYLSKAKLDGDKVKISRGYYHLAIFYYVVSNKDLTSIKYTDSIINTCKDCKDKDFPAMGYYAKGAYQYDSGMEKKALNNFLEALKILKTNNNIRLELKTRNAIINTNSNWINDSETLKYLLELLNFLKEQENYKIKYNEEYALAIFNLSNSYIRIGEYEKSLELSKYGVYNDIKQGKEITFYHFISQAGTAQYYLGNYQAAIDSSLKALPHLIKTNDRDLFMRYYYLAKSYDKLNQPEKAHDYFLKVDFMYVKTQDLFPELRNTYEHIVEYYKEKGDTEQQLFYLERLIETDAKLDSVYKYVTETVNKKFDTPQVIAERNRLLEEAKAKESSWKYGFGIIAVTLLTVLGILVAVFRRQKYYKQRFESVMNTSISQNENTKTSTKRIERSRNASQDIGVPQEIVENILIQLQKFETTQQFTKQVSLTELAKKLGTNPKYLSKVINGHYQKNFSSYINELRIEYVISKLKTDSKFRNYTIKAIAQEAGFGNTESFSKAFYKSTGIKPSYFIKQLQKRLES